VGGALGSTPATAMCVRMKGMPGGLAGDKPRKNPIRSAWDFIKKGAGAAAGAAGGAASLIRGLPGGALGLPAAGAALVAAAGTEAGNLIDKHLLHGGATAANRLSGNLGLNASIDAIGHLLGTGDRRGGPAFTPVRLPHLTTTINLHMDGKKVSTVVQRDILNTATRKGAYHGPVRPSGGGV
jgi:hypothetical protein